MFLGTENIILGLFLEFEIKFTLKCGIKITFCSIGLIYIQLTTIVVPTNEKTKVVQLFKALLIYTAKSGIVLSNPSLLLFRKLPIAVICYYNVQNDVTL